MDTKKRNIDESKMPYYNALEAIRRSGVCNMWGVTEYLMYDYPELTRDEAKKILLEWMENYEELCEMQGWRNFE